MLVGREHECTLIDRLLDGARAGESGALVLRGEAGIGKSALLEYAAAAATGMTVLRALGVESEAELEFSGLLEVLRPVLGEIDELPERQADVLRGALGINWSEAVDRFAVGAATLSLLATAAESESLLLLVDDAHWLDRSSTDALLFAARRLVADPVATLFAAREGEGHPFDVAGLVELQLEGLDRTASRKILASGAPSALAPGVAERIHEATAGNPLALLEVRALLTHQQLTGEQPLEDPLPAGATLERGYARRFAALPEDARRALLVAAIGKSHELEPILATLAVLHLRAGSLEPAEDAGLVRIERERLVFGHPLVRSAVFYAAPPSERRAAHAAFARALADGGSVEARAWHLAAATLGPDEEAAAALADAAEKARERSGYASAAAALERAVKLTPDEQTRHERLYAAADAAWLAGRSATALTLVEEIVERCEEPTLRAQALHLRGHIEHLAGGSPRETAASPTTLLSARMARLSS